MAACLRGCVASAVLMGAVCSAAAGQGAGRAAPAAGSATDAPGLYLGVNVALGAASALTRAVAHRESLVRALVGGALGGGITFAGQRAIGSGREELRFAGLQLVAIGGAVARNAGTDGPLYRDLNLPVLPLWVRIAPADGPPVSVRLSVMSTAALLWGAGRYDTHPDWRETLISGTPVLRRRGAPLHCWDWSRTRWGEDVCLVGYAAVHVHGTVHLAGPVDGVSMAHEFGHVAQHVRNAVHIAIPASDAALEAAGMRGVARWLVVDAALLLPLLDQVTRHALGEGTMADSFYEREVEFMMGRRLCREHACNW